jgi:hypothetical protein
VSFQALGASVAIDPNPEIAKIQSGFLLVPAGNDVPGISQHVQNKKIRIPQENSVDVTNVGGLFAEVEIRVAGRLTKQTLFVLATPITLKAGPHELHHQGRPAARASYNVQSFHFLEPLINYKAASPQGNLQSKLLRRSELSNRHRLRGTRFNPRARQ